MPSFSPSFDSLCFSPVSIKNTYSVLQISLISWYLLLSPFNVSSYLLSPLISSYLLLSHLISSLTRLRGRVLVFDRQQDCHPRIRLHIVRCLPGERYGGSEHDCWNLSHRFVVPRKAEQILVYFEYKNSSSFCNCRGPQTIRSSFEKLFHLWDYEIVLIYKSRG